MIRVGVFVCALAAALYIGGTAWEFYTARTDRMEADARYGKQVVDEEMERMLRYGR